jgi:3,4-dihydroxy-9,10-secoandrosta-1,3,5(10)-triene-9,17-dione 4,5-dioxygenase
MSTPRPVRALGYLRLAATDIEGWRRVATGVLGLAASDDGPIADSLRLRTDERPYRIELVPGNAHAVIGVGWEVADAGGLDAVARLLEARGIVSSHGSATLLKERAVSALLMATDPCGLPVEFFWGPQLAKQRFVSPNGTRFVTGDFGLGHVVFRLPRQRIQEEIELYEALGFRLSDRFRIGNDYARFMRCNGRHHSFAIGEGDAPASLVHFMLEAEDLDSVGLALDLALDGAMKVKRQLGRHTNDRMVSFYAETPSGFDVEFGWGGRIVDDSNWSVAEVAGGTLWGHRPPG